MSVGSWLGLLGPVGIAVALMVAGLLSRRLGSATRAAPYYVGFYVAAGCVGVSVAARVVNTAFALATPDVIRSSVGWVLLYNGLPALGVSIGVFVAWRYWSWLLAERD